MRRTRLIFSALIIGSMAPDFPYFLSLTDGLHFGHTLAGVFLFCLPAGLVVLWLYHTVVKRPLLALAPEYVRLRVSEDDLQFRFGPASQFLLIVFSLLLGTFTHILWDGLTHDHGYFVKEWAVFSTPVQLHHVVPLYKALQFGCSAFGMAVIFAVTVWWWSRKRPVARPVAAEMTPRLRRFLIAIGVVLDLCAGAAGYLVYLSHDHHWKGALVEAVIVAISAACVEILLFALGWQASRRMAKKQEPPDRSVRRLDVSNEA